MAYKIDIIVPCFNEEEIIKKTNTSLLTLLEDLINKGEISNESYICYIDDGSKDKTWNIIEELTKENKNIKGIKLANNTGHQNAILSGLQNSKADANISIDADLQDDITVIPEMIKQFKNGFDVVYGVRNNRKKDSFFKKYTAQAFYKLIKLMGVNIVYNHADFRLLSKVVINSLSEYKEVNLFLRGIIPLIGYKSTNVYYERLERTAGVSKYGFFKMLAFAWDGITSFSITPLRIITNLGFLIFFASVIVSFWVLFIRFFTTSAVPGWASTALPIYFIGGVQILSIGIVGEYVGKIYLEAKKRPRYIIEKTI
jgi:glycosyltransferase involved in cell wall biosynthesis